MDWMLLRAKGPYNIREKCARSTRLTDAAGSEWPVRRGRRWLLSFRRGIGGRLQQVPGASAEIAEIHPSGINGGGQSLGQIQCLVDDERLRGPFLTHVRQDGALGAGRDDGIGDPIDPDAGAPALATVVTADRFEGEDLVGARVFPEAEEHHAWVGGHRSSIAALRSACGVGAAATGERSPTGF